MKEKKTNQANLEKKAFSNFLLSVVVVLCIILVSFEWGTQKKSNDLSYNMGQEIQIEEQMIATKREEPKKPEVKQPEVLQVLDIVDDNIEVADFEFEFEVDDNTEYDFIISDDEEEIIEEVTPFYIVEDMPQFNGGDMSEFWKFAMKNIRYPEVAAENGVSGTVYMQFTVSTAGYVIDVKVIKGVHPDIDKEAIRVIKSSPRWTPGKQRGRAVPVIMSLPMKFILQ